MKYKMATLGALITLGATGVLMNPSKAAGQGPPNGVAVNVVNPLPVPVRPVGDPFEPVLVNASCNGVSPASGCSANLFTVPAGKRLVVEYFSAFANLPLPGNSARVSLQAGDVSRAILLPLLPPAAPGVLGGAFTSGGQAVRMYIEPLTVVSGFAIRSAGDGNFTFAFQMTGHLEDVTP